MPIYEYTCQSCGLRFDALRPMKDADAPIACKGCRGEQTRRALSVFYASSDGRSVASASTSCSGCSGCSGSCSSCTH